MQQPRLAPLTLDAAQEREIAALVEALSTQQLAQQLSGRAAWHALTPWTYRWGTYPSGGIPEQGIPPLHFTDGPRGVNVGRSTAFPSASTRGAAWDPALEERVGEAMGREARRAGATAMGSACINLVRHPAWGRAQESLGSDPYHVGALGAAHVRGLGRHVLPVVKHFALNSIENSRFRVNVVVDDCTLREIYLPHFFATLRAGAGAVMTAYNKVNGTYCGENGALFGVLRDEWGFDGFTTSDFFLGCRSAVASLTAGLDQEMPQAFYFHPANLARLIARGDVSPQQLRRAARRILRARAAYGVLRPEGAPSVSTEQHQALALEAAEAAIVVARDRGQILPLPRRARVGVVGALAADPFCGSEGSVSVAPPFAISPLEGLREVYSRVTYEPRLRPWAVGRLAAQVDYVVLVVGSRPRDEGEYFPFLGGGDRASLTLRPEEVRAIEAAVTSGRPTVVVWVGGGLPALGDWSARVGCLLLAGHGGMQGGRALANVLYGAAVPGGHTSACIAHERDDLAPFDASAREVVYDRWFDYRRYDRAGTRPLLFVGHGSAHTRLRASGASVARRSLGADDYVSLQLTLHNDGPLDATPVVTLFVGSSESETPPREPLTLRGFSKLLVPGGQARGVRIDAPVCELSEWDSAEHAWVLRPGPRRVAFSIAGGDRVALGQVVLRG